MKQGKKSSPGVAGAVLLSVSLCVAFPVPVEFSNCLAPKGFSHQPQPKKKNGVLHAFERNMEKAALIMGMSPADLRRFLEPERIVEVTGEILTEKGTPLRFHGGRVVHSTVRGPGKGGIRAAEGLDASEEVGLAGLMSIKTAVINIDTGGGKGGIDVNPRKMSPVDFGRVLRAYVREVMDTTWREHGTIAFHLLTDVPAPDMNTKAVHMNVCIDEVLRWLAEHGDDYYRWLGSKVGRDDEIMKYHLPVDLRALLKNNPPLEGPDEEDPQKMVPKTPFLDLYYRLHAERKDIVPTLSLIAAFTSKDKTKGGSLGRDAATGLGVVYSTLQIMSRDGVLESDREFKRKGSLSPVTVAVEGYGNVGEWAAKKYAAMGAKVTTIAEFDGKEAFAFYLESGFTPEVLADLDGYILEQRKLKKDFESTNGTFMRGYAAVNPAIRVISTREFWQSQVDVLAPCARDGQINQQTAPLVRARYIAEGANAPTTPEADEGLHAGGVRIIPDVYANSGGVSVSFLEMLQNHAGEVWSEEKVNQRLYELMKESAEKILFVANIYDCSLRHAAFILAIERIQEARSSKASRGGVVIEPIVDLHFAGYEHLNGGNGNGYHAVENAV